MTPRPGGRVQRAATVWWEAVSGGAFYNRWSAWLSLVLASLVAVPTLEQGAPTGYAKAVIVAAIGWVLLAAMAVPAAIAERRWSSRTARGVVVLAVLLLAASLRGPLNDLLSVWVWGLNSEGESGFGARAVSNALAALALFSFVAIAHTQYARRRAIGARLENAIAPLRARLRLAQAHADETPEILAATAQRLRADRDRMLAGTIDFEAVSAYAADVRAESHRFEERANATDVAEVSGTDAVDVQPEPRRSLSQRLAAPPWAVAALVYCIATAPFSIPTGGWGIFAIGVVGLVIIDVIGNIVVRWLIPAPGTPGRPVCFIGTWVLAGIAVAALSHAILPGIGMLAYVGIIAFPGLILIVSLSMDAMRVASSAAGRSELILTQVARYVAEETARGSDPLRQAVGLLHGRVQGRCVILAAQADDGTPSATQIAEFRAQTDEAFDDLLSPVNDTEVRRGSLGGTALGPLDRMVAAWRAVMEISLTIAPDAVTALADREVAEGAADVVNEALVNAVKHSGARQASVAVSRAEETGLRVQITSPGTLAAPVHRAAGIGASRPGVTIRQSGADVVLDAVVAG
ncbi:hypothetical protein GCM10009808_11490 [Microbacterium sediminicola]|uniref:Signal transduction histidine kinase n=1 Tax=Microbacterium sediminicola TaxID=415210 RepID=A0ABN2HZR3_9MICO